jgi:hypothetical protein
MNRINIEYFTALLEKYLEEKFPGFPDRDEQVKARSRKALQAYRELAGKGVCHQTALEIACLELTDSLGFSLFQFLYDMVFDDFKEIPDETRRDFCISILPECQKASLNLSCEGMEEWEARFHFEERMSGIIQNAIASGVSNLLPDIIRKRPV